MKHILRATLTLSTLSAALIIGAIWHPSAHAEPTHSTRELELFRQVRNDLLDHIARGDSAAVSTSIENLRAFIADYPQSIQQRSAYLSLLEAHTFAGGDCALVSGLADTALADYAAHSEQHLAASALAANACDPQHSAALCRRAIAALADTTNAHMPRYLLTLGTIQRQQGKKGEAITTLRRALLLDAQIARKNDREGGYFKGELERALAQVQTDK